MIALIYSHRFQAYKHDWDKFKKESSQKGKITKRKEDIERKRGTFHGCIYRWNVASSTLPNGLALFLTYL
jgi:hypothetical protein